MYNSVEDRDMQEGEGLEARHSLRMDYTPHARIRMSTTKSKKSSRISFWKYAAVYISDDDHLPLLCMFWRIHRALVPSEAISFYIWLERGGRAAWRYMQVCWDMHLPSQPTWTWCIRSVPIYHPRHRTAKDLRGMIELQQRDGAESNAAKSVVEDGSEEPEDCESDQVSTFD